MKWRYVWLALFIVGLFYLANTNPGKSEYSRWAAKQLVTRSEIHEQLKKTEKEDPDGIIGEIASLGKRLADKYVQPQVGLLIDHYTTEKNYLFFSTYTTKLTIGKETYKYVTVGLAGNFVVVDAPKKGRG
ncbi:DUF4359 domain-containing protein [Microbacteriaceae bacterium 4G12]